MKYFAKLLPLLFTILKLLNKVNSDLPVHCLSVKIEGDWLIHMGENRFDKDLKCGHKRPDQNLDHYDIDVEKIFKQKYEIVFKLERPDKVLSLKDNKPIGKWTMIYDEGFEFSIHNQIFFAFSRYKKVGKFSPSNTDTLETAGYKNICEKTFIGWYHNKETNKDWGCYFAEKIDVKERRYDLSKLNYNNIFQPKIPIKEHKSIPIQKDSGINKEKSNLEALNQLKNSYLKKKNDQGERSKISEENNLKNLDSNNQKFTEMTGEPDNTTNISTNSGNISYIDFVKSLGWASSSGKPEHEIPHLDIYFINDDEKTDSGFLELNTNTKLFQPNVNYVNKVNDPKNKYTWTAKIYDDFVGKSYSEMRNMLGRVNFLKSFSEEEPEKNLNSFLEFNVSSSMKSKEEVDNSDIEIENHEKDVSQIQHSKYGQLPATFDWRNVDGTNYDSPIRKQGECGSCYAIAAVSVLESRIRIKSNNRVKPVLSPSSVISCSRYNQGCSGGYPFLVGKFAKEFGFVEESCQPYSEADDKCYDYCFHQKVYKAKEYGYVGGYYGGCDEESMMREIYENGPIVVAINATPELYYYSKGIFHSDAKKSEGTFEKNVKPWEYTNHAIVCVGWGEETVNDNVVKYWILKNSWGETWGEQGYFRLTKGSNMASVEAQGVYLIPELD